MSVCTNCNGAKRVMGMGMVQKQCPTCQGTGFETPAVSDQSKRIAELEAELRAMNMAREMLNKVGTPIQEQMNKEPELNELIKPMGTVQGIASPMSIPAVLKRPGRPKRA